MTDDLLKGRQDAALRVLLARIQVAKGYARKGNEEALIAYVAQAWNAFRDAEEIYSSSKLIARIAPFLGHAVGVASGMNLKDLGVRQRLFESLERAEKMLCDEYSQPLSHAA